MTSYRPLLACGVFALISLVGCASRAPTAPSQTAAVTAQTSFADLQGIFLAKYPKASRLVSADGYLPRTAQEFEDVAGANAVATDDFMRWCELKGGVAYREVARTSVPVEVRDLAKAGEAIFQVQAQVYQSQVDVPACVIAVRTHILYSARAFNTPGGRVFRAIAWMSPDDLATFGPRAQATIAERHRGDFEKRQQESAAEEASQKRAAAQRSAFLERSPKGTQVACDARQRSGQSVNELTFNCNGLYVFFNDLPKNGWRINSQSSTPEADSIGIMGNRVTLLVEKLR
ncbi:hypothetical protein [Mitsuaria sp. 7]|uniref:hypothetical protein n=1 Tax=Mitsuaria sp. 7 TaxID=1658665 RepID=UPI0007DCE227|nr:hypothetical protein [Mitsuaria sp. 7]ANH66650.1 hypothetical protein ABE85_02070 [Mitsuaria sp. 7]